MNNTQPSAVHWLDWGKPALPAVIDWLDEKYRKDRRWDLSDVLIVTPGARSRHRLLELIVDRAERERLDLEPPNFALPSQLPERLYVPRHEFAGEAAQLTAWARALQATSPIDLQTLVKVVPPEEALSAWLPLARLLRTLHVDLASEAMSFSDVSQAIQALGIDTERSRWQLLERLQRAYYDQLKSVDLWDLQAARLMAIRRRECRFSGAIVLVGMVDLNRVFRQLLAQLPGQVHSLVFAGPETRDGFDELGSLRSEYWSEHLIDLRDDQIRVADRPADQASGVIDELSRLNGAYPAEEIIVGVPDRTVVAHIRRALDFAGVASRDGAGKPLRLSLPFRLIQAIADYLRLPDFAHYSRLVRHPDCFDWISDRIGDRDWLRPLDEFQNKLIPSEITLQEGFRSSAEIILQRVHGAVRELLSPLAGRANRLSHWAEAWSNVLVEIYGQREGDGESPASREVLEACLKIQAGLQGLSDIPSDWSVRGSACDALELVLDPLTEVTLAEPEKSNVIELVGWLDLPLDDSAVTVVVGFNEGFVPSSETAHWFMPNALRARLGIVDNARRYARDAYALALMAKSRRRLALICGRRDGSGDPQLPSRLLFATDNQTMAGRAQAYFCHRAEATTPLWLATATEPPKTQQFVVPRPQTDDLRISTLRVTDFKSYLQCPYRFYLDRVLKLRSITDDLYELPAEAFGILVHRVVESFGRDPLKDSTDPSEIREFFGRRLNDEIERLGEKPSAAVRIQYQQLRLRLDRFAEVQAERRREGWQILEVEIPQATVTWVVDGEPFVIGGRIDRIDRHLGTGELAVFDYKTREPATSPDKAHREQGAWIDLQLPLYRHLIRQREYFDGCPIRLGYILLPGDLKKTEFALAEWSEPELLEADGVAEEVIRAVRRNAFWPPADPPPKYADTWEAICQDRVSERWLAEAAP